MTTQNTRKAEAARQAIEQYLANGGAIHRIPEGKTALLPRLYFSQLQKHIGLTNVSEGSSTGRRRFAHNLSA